MRGIQERSGKLEEIERSSQLEEDFEGMRKECEHIENLKNVDDLGEGGEIIQLQKEKERQEKKNLQN